MWGNGTEMEEVLALLADSTDHQEIALLDCGPQKRSSLPIPVLKEDARSGYFILLIFIVRDTFSLYVPDSPFIYWEVRVKRKTLKWVKHKQCLQLQLSLISLVTRKKPMRPAPSFVCRGALARQLPLQVITQYKNRTPKQ